MTIRKHVAAMILTGAVCMLPMYSLPLQAADQSPAPLSGVPGPDQVVNILAGKLSLTDDQKAQITPIIAERQQKMRALQSDTSERPRRKARKMKGILTDSDKKINAILTPDQQKQYAQIEQHMREQMKQRMQQQKNAEPPQ